MVVDMEKNEARVLAVSAAVAEPSQCTSGLCSQPSTRITLPAQHTHGFFRSGGTFSTTMFLAKFALGAGLLSLGLYTERVGLVFELAFLLAGGVLCFLGVCLLSEVVITTSCYTYEDVTEKLCHPIVSYWTGVMNAVSLLGTASVGLLACGQVFQVLTGANESSRRTVVAIVGITVCGPMSLPPRLGYLRHLVMLSTFSMLLLVAAVAMHLAEHGIHDTITTQTLWWGRGDVGFFAFMNAASNIIFACDQAAAVPRLAGEMTPEPTVWRMRVGTGACSTALFLLYGSVSVLSMLGFGVEDEQDTFIGSLQATRGRLLTIVTLLAVAFSCVVQFPMLLCPVRQFCAYCIRKLAESWGSSDGKLQGSGNVKGCSSTWQLDMLLGVALVLVTVLVTVAVAEIHVILSFIGALATSWVSYILPSILFIQMRRLEKKFTLRSAEVMASFALLAVGVFFSIVGTCAAVLG